MRILFLYTAFALVSCQVKIRTVGKEITTKRHVSDTLIFLGVHDSSKVPEDAELISNISVRSPFQGNGWNDPPSHYMRLCEYAKAEGIKKGGNIVKVTRFDNLATTIHFSSRVSAQIFYLNEPSFSSYRAVLAKAKAIHEDSIKDLCIIHVKVNCKAEYYGDLFFNTKKVVSWAGNNNQKKTQRINLVFKEGGILSLARSSTATDSESFSLVKGKEYFISLTIKPMKRGQLYEKGVLSQISQEEFLEQERNY